jgi:hypothetical protein
MNTIRQYAEITIEGSAYGKLSNIVPPNNEGNDCAGDDRKPPIIGPMVLPNPPITPKRAIPFAEFESSDISPKYVLATPIFPFNNPHIKRDTTANKNVGANPKLMAHIAIEKILSTESV